MEAGQPGIDPESVRSEYNSINEIWARGDRWHQFTRSTISRFVLNFFSGLSSGQKLRVLNAGSGGNDYGLMGHEQLHVDIAELKIQGIPNSLIANVEEMPLNDNDFDICLCVGSVLNYCDPVKAIQEFSRLVKPQGKLILEFEASKCFEFIFHSSFNQSAALVETFYLGNRERLWVYSEDYILAILHLNGFVLTDLQRFHIISPLVYALTRNSGFASCFAALDRILSWFPFLNKFSANIILSCEKRV
jgi:SAM-dependent methyltransferase